MVGQNEWPRNSYDCGRMIADGIKGNNAERIELGLSRAIDLFVDYVLGDRRDSLLTLGRDLNNAYLPHRREVKDQFIKTISYLGQVRALVNLCDYITQRLIPEEAWRAVSQSKYAKSILQTLLKNGTLQASELCSSVGLPHRSQLLRTIRPLVDEGLVRREIFGKNVWYSLTSDGRLMSNRYFGALDTGTLESILVGIMTNLRSEWLSLQELIDGIAIDLHTTVQSSLVTAVLWALRRAKIVEEDGGRWRIVQIPPRQEQELVDISKFPELLRSVELIEKEYERLRTDGVIKQNHIDEAEKILINMYTEFAKKSIERPDILVRVIFEKAKCSALNGNYQSTFALMKEAETLAQAHDIESKWMESQIRMIWPYIQTTCIEPQLVLAKANVDNRRYYETRDTLLTIFGILAGSYGHKAQPDLPVEILQIAVDLATAADELQQEQEVEQKIDDTTGLPTQQLICEEFRRWQLHRPLLKSRILKALYPTIVDDSQDRLYQKR